MEFKHIIMKKSLLMLIFSASTLFFCARKNTSVIMNTMSKPAVSDSLYKFKVSFISKGSGIDFKAVETLTKYLSENNIESKTKSWGREGEKDFYLFPSSKYSDVQDKISVIKSLLESSDRVRYYENQVLK
jgi:hypothetical protein